MKPILTALFLSLLLLSSPTLAEPSWFNKGAIYASPNIITSFDRSAFSSIKYKGREVLDVYNMCKKDWYEDNAFLFEATYSDNQTLELQLESKFLNNASAEVAAQRYAKKLGQIPYLFRKGVDSASILLKNCTIGGGSGNIIINTGDAFFLTSMGILEETLLHEAGHAGFDDKYKHDPAWKRAQKKDGQYISWYARDFTEREDLAESMVLFYAVYFRPKSLSEADFDFVLNTMPHRIKYFVKILGLEERKLTY